MKILFLTNPLFSHTKGAINYIEPLTKNNEVHVFVDSKYSDLFLNINCTLHFYKQELHQINNNLINEYPEYHGGIGTIEKDKTIDDMLIEMEKMLEYSLRASKNYHDSIICDIRSLVPDLIFRDSCAIYGRTIADELGIKVYGYTTSLTLSEEEMQFNKRRYLELSQNYDLADLSDDEINIFWDKIKIVYKKICVYYGVRALPIGFLLNADEEKNFCYGLPFEKHSLINKTYFYFTPKIFENEYIAKNNDSCNSIYMSSGTILCFPIYVYNSIINYLKDSTTELNIAFKYWDTKIIKTEALPKNVKFYNYANQTELLKKSNLFITHGGYNSIIESIYYGVPMIVIPLVNDQFLSGYFLEKYGVAVVVKKREIVSSKDVKIAFDDFKKKTRINELRKIRNEILNLTRLSELNNYI